MIGKLNVFYYCGLLISFEQGIEKIYRIQIYALFLRFFKEKERGWGSCLKISINQVCSCFEIKDVHNLYILVDNFSRKGKQNSIIFVFCVVNKQVNQI